MKRENKINESTTTSDMTGMAGHTTVKSLTAVIVALNKIKLDCPDVYNHTIGIIGSLKGKLSKEQFKSIEKTILDSKCCSPNGPGLCYAGSRHYTHDHHSQQGLSRCQKRGEFYRRTGN